MSRPWRPPRCREHHQLWKPQYTYNTRGDMAMTGSSNSCRGAGPAEATEPPPHFQGGPGAASQVLAQVHIALVEGYHRDALTPRPAPWACYDGVSDPTQGRQCGLYGLNRETW